MATLMPGSAIRLPRALPAWLRVRPRSARDQGPRLVLGLIGGLLVIQAVRLLWALTVPLSPFGACQPPTAAITSPAETHALLPAFDPLSGTAGQRAPATPPTTHPPPPHRGTQNNEQRGGSGM